MNIILLGAPGAGKGTQAENIVNRYNIPAISTGNIIREAIANSTPLGVQAKQFSESGQLVPDEVVIGIITERLKREDCENGFILDGFPRTIPQAEALDKLNILIDVVLDIEVDDETVVKRLSGRRICSKCSNSYHVVYKKPKHDGICDTCGGKLIQRKDDNEMTVKTRLEEYHKLTEPLKDFYNQKGILKIVQGQEEVSETTKLVFDILDKI